jgi:hypothetical protein
MAVVGRGAPEGGMMLDVRMVPGVSGEVGVANEGAAERREGAPVNPVNGRRTGRAGTGIRGEGSEGRAGRALRGTGSSIGVVVGRAGILPGEVKLENSFSIIVAPGSAAESAGEVGGAGKEAAAGTPRVGRLDGDGFVSRRPS